jgi:hypothetical protein
VAYCGILQGLSRSKVCLHFEFVNFRYHRDETLSVEACEELRKRTDEEIKTAEKKSAIRRKVEKAQAEDKAK